MTPQEALEAIKKETSQIIKEEAHTLYTRLVQASPVDTSNFKNSWVAPEETSKDVWRIHNSAEYATILSAGRYQALGRMYGSKQWDKGLTPMLYKINNELQRRLDGIKH